VLTDLDSALFELINKDTSTILSLVSKLQIDIPVWAKMCFAFVWLRAPKIDISWFDEAPQFFLWYSKVLIRSADKIRSASWVREETIWKPFIPPTLMGVELKTKFRK
jgi:hypothetical protein